MGRIKHKLSTTAESGWIYDKRRSVNDNRHLRCFDVSIQSAKTLTVCQLRKESSANYRGYGIFTKNWNAKPTIVGSKLRMVRNFRMWVCTSLSAKKVTQVLETYSTESECH